MNPNSHKFMIGRTKCIVLQDTGGQPIGDMTPRFPGVEQATIDNAIAALKLTDAHLVGSMNTLLVDTGENRIVIDTGLGPGGDDYGLQLPGLISHGYAVDDIDTVIITHAHLDHIAGLQQADGALTFPNAHYFMWSTEWEHWRSADVVNNMSERVKAIAPARLDAIAGKITLIDDEATEILPGIRMISLPGHTPGHAGVMIESDGQSLLHAADMMHHLPQLVDPTWKFVADVQPDIAVTTRQSMLAQATEQNQLMVVYHFPFPGLGRIVRQDAHYNWQPDL